MRPGDPWYSVPLSRTPAEQPPAAATAALEAPVPSLHPCVCGSCARRCCAVFWACFGSAVAVMASTVCIKSLQRRKPLKGAHNTVRKGAAPNHCPVSRFLPLCLSRALFFSVALCLLSRPPAVGFAPFQRLCALCVSLSLTSAARRCGQVSACRRCGSLLCGTPVGGGLPPCHSDVNVGGLRNFSVCRCDTV